jgi:hypothetical protein
MARAYIEYNDDDSDKIMFQDEIGMMEIVELNDECFQLYMYRKSTDDQECEGEYATIELAKARMKAIADM